MNLVTIARFNMPLHAELTLNALNEEGIWAVLADKEVASMDALLIPAIGGIKVQVREEDAERAIAFLRENYGFTGVSLNIEVDEDELERQALEAAPDEIEEPPPAAELQPKEPAQVFRGYEDSRQQYARRFMFTSIYSIFFFPALFYAFYLFLNLAFGNGPMNRTAWRQTIIGLLCLIPFLLVTSYLASWFGLSLLIEI